MRSRECSTNTEHQTMTTKNVRVLLCALCSALLGTAAIAATHSAEAYPSRPIRIVLGFPPGGSDDYLARIIGPKLSERVGQSVVVDNRPGASSNLGAELTARATPDGYTLFLGPVTTLAASRALFPK